MPVPLWSVLHRAVDFVADSGDAPRQAGGREVRAVVARFAVRYFRETGATGGVQQSAAERSDVRCEWRGGDGVSHAA